VHSPETIATFEIPGVDMVQGEAPTEFANNDLDFASSNNDNANPLLVNTPPPVNNAPVVTKISTYKGIHRSTQVCTQPKLQYIPAYGEKNYLYATTALSRKMQDDIEYCYNQYYH
jgi:hypothetical protein